MRVTAIAANLLFIGYGTLGSFYPVALLHFVLLPLSAARLAEQWGGWSMRRGKLGDMPVSEAARPTCKSRNATRLRRVTVQT
jgi:hypothetical protein